MVNAIHVFLVIGVQLAIKLGIIGYRNHASRLISLCAQIESCKIEFIYHPTKSIEDQRFTNNFSDLLNCDAIIIATPNHTHFEYIKKLLEDFNGYIFCEKPPVASLNEIETLMKLPTKTKEKVFFNFNYRFSRLGEIIENYSSSQQIGNIIHINFVMNHGLAFKEQYLKSWRSDGQKNLHNILETLTIHYLDLCNFFFGNPLDVSYFPSLMSKHGSSYDTCNLSAQYADGKTVSISNSYASPYINETTIIGTNGVISIRENQLNIRSPRDTFDEKGFFTTAPIISSQEFDTENEYDNSLKNSLSYFISNVEKGKPISLEHFKTSLETNRLILQLQNK
jgi:predicted dehydrogenase